ncbi:hypothetical protein IDSA_11715 [Pseudidiomarina salinarum]|uniref:Uncharacterized protein n=1 Tax=Pseudidiomarina salinarum TaxID=435908 RepID=A0A094L5V6_9GAMM|nr:hypothetical protein [Pseudidiomarina salinarum]KFZ30113.1 hypothetical protein IDSA_11715 [Pseudidiomarina salinarum]RUO68234.1 hypothetical protein CWI79_11700 [Pseudidiomarina salinarum]
MYRSNGFALPLVTALLVVFSGAWLNYHPEGQTLRDLRKAQQIHQELLFWHQGVLAYRKDYGYWPATLTSLSGAYSLPPIPAWLQGYQQLGNFRFVIRNLTEDQLAHFYEPLEQVAEYDNGELVISLPAPGTGAASSKKVMRVSTQPPVMEVALSLNNQILFNIRTLDSDSLGANEIKITNIVSDTAIVDNLAVADIYGQDVVANGFSLNQLSADTAALYQALWNCMYVSGHCLKARSTF